MTRTLVRVGLGTVALAIVAAVSVVLTLAVSRSDGPRTYTQEEVEQQLAAARAASAEPTPTPTPSDTPAAPAEPAETSVVTDQGTFVGRCVSGYPLLSRWTLNAGYRLTEADSKLAGVLRPGPVPWLVLKSGDKADVWRVYAAGLGVPAVLALQDDKDALSWVLFACEKDRFNAHTIPAEPRKVR